MQAQEIQHIIEKAANFLTQADAESFCALFTDDGEFIVPGMRFVGREAIRQTLVNFATTASDIRITISQTIIATQPSSDSDHAVVEWHWENIEIATGNRYQADDAIAIDFRSGQISRWREYIDTTSPSL